MKGSLQKEEDEEELKWAAIEKLPTYLQMSRGILIEDQGQPIGIDINKLGHLQRKNLVERLVKIAEEDNEKFLLKLRERIDRVGLEIPRIEVRFEHLNVEAEAHVGGRALPTIFNFSINLLEVINGHGMEEFVPQNINIHKSNWSADRRNDRETLSFSARCQGIGNHYASALEGQETNVVKDYIMQILGLEACADTMVGDNMIRGISGVLKKRVTIGEMLVGPARALSMDEISTGLDSSTTFYMINSLRQSIHILSGTDVISLLQPALETYELFDDIVLLSDGQIVYKGPRESVLEFFEYMGFKCPERKGDFLQEVNF